MADSRAFLDDREWRKYINKTMKTIKTSEKTLKVAYATIGFRDIIKHFKDESGPKKGWVKRKDKKPHGLLKDTGNLRRNFLPSNTKKVNNKTILIFNTAPYSGIHDRGSKQKNIPQREFMWFGSRAMNTMAKFFLSKIT